MGADATKARGLYFVSATPTQYSASTFEADLFKLNERGKLQLVRQLAAPSEGVSKVQETNDALIVSFPHIVYTSLSIVHKSSPETVDRVDFNPTARIISNSHFLVAKTGKEEFSELVEFTAQNKDLHELWRVALRASGLASDRVSKADIQDFARPFITGAPGGPAGTGALQVSHEGNRLILRIGKTGSVPISEIPESVSLGSKDVGVVAATDKFFIVTAVQPRELLFSGAVKSVTDFVHNLAADKWVSLDVPGGFSRQRIFGNWLAVIERHISSGPEVSPGRLHERAENTSGRPSVQSLYAQDWGYHATYPGRLWLINLQDLSKIKIETHEEDSEILLVTSSGIVYYRINDKIYTAKIAANSLIDSSLLVSGDDVPEIHWAFAN